MDMTALLVLLSVVGTLSGVYLGWSAKGREQAREYRSEGSTSARLQADVDYIKRGVDELRMEVKDQGRRFDELAERVTRVEESSKQAHKRIDRVERNLPDGGAHD